MSVWWFLGAGAFWCWCVLAPGRFGAGAFWWLPAGLFFVVRGVLLGRRVEVSGAWCLEAVLAQVDLASVGFGVSGIWRQWDLASVGFGVVSSAGAGVVGWGLLQVGQQGRLSVFWLSAGGVVKVAWCFNLRWLLICVRAAWGWSSVSRGLPGARDWRASLMASEFWSMWACYVVCPVRDWWTMAMSFLVRSWTCGGELGSGLLGEFQAY